jgi:hypothetical protein
MLPLVLVGMRNDACAYYHGVFGHHGARTPLVQDAPGCWFYRQGSNAAKNHLICCNVWIHCCHHRPTQHIYLLWVTVMFIYRAFRCHDMRALRALPTTLTMWFRVTLPTTTYIFDTLALANGH